MRPFLPGHSNGNSRAVSVRPSRAGSTARDIVKRRDKPYKTEKQLVLTRKRKLDIHTSYTNAPHGYRFLAVGTPDLAERCKEVSRQKGLPVHVVNAQPTSIHANNPDKISHHVHRIGYHFKAEVIEEACDQLGYIFYKNQYIKESVLQKKREEGSFARLLAKYGVDPKYAQHQQQTQLDDPELVRAAIKELFPRIPEQDLNEIVRHAWQEGTGRVGTIATLELPRRVQLATLARIRHMYTDYDQLLRAFEWKEARREVEPDCLRKLIEWRGEESLEDDNELEEIVRETIVIDSDDDDMSVHGSEADDEDSVVEVEQGNVSDTSIEISHRVAADDDLGAESGPDGRSKRMLDRFLPRNRSFGQRNTNAAQQTRVVREPLWGSTTQPRQSLQHVLPHAHYQDDRGQPLAYPDERGRYQREVIIDGRRHQLVSDAHTAPETRAFQPLHATQDVTHVQVPLAPGVTASDRGYYRSDGLNRPFTAQEYPVASIENSDGTNRPALHLANDPRARTPETGNAQTRRLRPQVETAPSFAEDNFRPVQNDRRAFFPEKDPRNFPPRVEVVDLTSPSRPERGNHLGSIRSDRSAVLLTRYVEHYQPPEQRPVSSILYDRPRSGHDIPPHTRYPALPSRAVPYELRPLPNGEGYAQYQPAILADPGLARPSTGGLHQAYPQYASTSYQSNGQGHEQPQVYQQAVLQQPPHQPYIQRPIHGEPAPIQLIPRDVAQLGQPSGRGASQRGELQRRQYTPADGGIAPTQYYYAH